jgi:hypothetical protein
MLYYSSSPHERNGGTLLNNVMQACKGDIEFSQTSYGKTTLLNKLLFYLKQQQDLII